MWKFTAYYVYMYIYIYTFPNGETSWWSAVILSPNFSFLTYFWHQKTNRRIKITNCIFAMINIYTPLLHIFFKDFLSSLCVDIISTDELKNRYGLKKPTIKKDNSYLPKSTSSCIWVFHLLYLCDCETKKRIERDLTWAKVNYLEGRLVWRRLNFSFLGYPTSSSAITLHKLKKKGKNEKVWAIKITQVHVLLPWTD